MTYTIIIRGPAGIGKTTVSKLLAKSINGEYISMDETIDNTELIHDKEEGMISQRSFLKANEMIQPQIARAKCAIVIDGCFYWKSQIEDLIEKSKECYVFTLKSDIDTCIERDKGRKSIGEDAIRAVYNAVTKFDSGITIDTSDTDQEMLVERIRENLPFHGIERKLITANEIMTLANYPVHSQEKLREYYDYIEGRERILPPCPVIHISQGLPLVKEIDEKTRKHNELIRKFIAEHPEVKYIMLDGNHKCTAATLAGKPISILVLKNAEDIREGRKMLEKGKLPSFSVDNSSIQEELENLSKYFLRKPSFETVKEKTERMVRDKAVPDYMISNIPFNL